MIAPCISPSGQGCAFCGYRERMADDRLILHMEISNFVY